jgi:hypothetical protein
LRCEINKFCAMHFVILHCFVFNILRNTSFRKKSLRNIYDVECVHVSSD